MKKKEENKGKIQQTGNTLKIKAAINTISKKCQDELHPEANARDWHCMSTLPAHDRCQGENGGEGGDGTVPSQVTSTHGVTSRICKVAK